MTILQAIQKTTEVIKTWAENKFVANSAIGSMASKSTVSKSDLASDVQTSLGKADTALQSFTEKDPTVPSWAKASTKPSYTKSEVGLGNVDNVKQYSASNPPPYPVSSVNDKTGVVELTLSDLGVTATAAELNFVDGVTSSIQTQLNGKAASSHGTHVTYSTTAPVVAGTAAVGSANTVARGDHVHPAQTSVSGNAGTATKLAASVTVRTNLASTSTASFDGSTNITPGVNGTLPVGNGGTGYNSITDTAYTTARYRASSLHSSDTKPSSNGTITWVYG